MLGPDVVKHAMGIEPPGFVLREADDLRGEVLRHQAVAQVLAECYYRLWDVQHFLPPANIERQRSKARAIRFLFDDFLVFTVS